ncbi:MAG: LysM peptidoglycan-binding domain-containing protein [Actinomycetales bacterium]
MLRWRLLLVLGAILGLVLACLGLAAGAHAALAEVTASRAREVVPLVELACYSLLSLILGWLALATLASCVQVLRGLQCPRVSPRVLHRLVVAVLGAGLVLAPVTAQAIEPSASASQAQGVDPGWGAAPSERAADSATSSGSADRLAPAAELTFGDPGWLPPIPAQTRVAPEADPNILGRPAAQSGPGEVVVVRGDTLWDIAARHLGPDPTPTRIAAEWPRWYTANADVIGPDPDLIRPGQVLRPPPA